MNAAAATIHSIQVGRIAPLGPEHVPSAFLKTPVSGQVACGLLGLAGDEQADPSVHGGPEKAVYAYALSRYAAWRTTHPQHAAQFTPGAFGENLTLEGCDELTICVDDIVRAGSALLQVSQPRQPCFKFALRFDDPRMPNAMARNGYCGWYYRVLEPGTLSAGDAVLLQQRPCPEWPVDRVNRLITQRHGTAADRAAFAARSAFKRNVPA